MTRPFERASKRARNSATVIVVGGLLAVIAVGQDVGPQVRIDVNGNKFAR